MYDPMADEIAEKQIRAHRAMYDPMDVDQWDRDAQNRARKQDLLHLLKTDPELREEVKKIINE